MVIGIRWNESFTFQLNWLYEDALQPGHIILRQGVLISHYFFDYVSFIGVLIYQEGQQINDIFTFE